MGGGVLVALPLSLCLVLSSRGVRAFAEGGVPALSLCFKSHFHQAVTTPTWVQWQLELPALLPVGWGKVTQPPPGTLGFRIVLMFAIGFQKKLHGDLDVAFQYLNGL